MIPLYLTNPSCSHLPNLATSFPRGKSIQLNMGLKHWLGYRLLSSEDPRPRGMVMAPVFACPSGSLWESMQFTWSEAKAEVITPLGVKRPFHMGLRYPAYLHYDS